MARGKNTFSLAAGFNITGQQPIDSRLVVDNVADLYLAETWEGVGLYNGLVVAIKSTGALFVLKNRDDYSNTASWVAVGGDVSADLSALTARVGVVEGKVAVAADSGLDATNALRVKIDSTVDGNILQVSENGLSVVASQSEYSLTAVASPNAAYAAQYEFKKDGEVQTTINIPKDQFLKSATFHAEKEAEATVEAPYLKFIWQLDTDSAVEGDQSVTYVPVADLVDTYEGSDYIEVSANKISVKYDVLKSQLATDLKSEFGIETISTNVVNNASAIEALQATINAENTGLSAVVASHTTKIGTLESSVGTLSTTVENHGTEISGIKATLSDYKVRNVNTDASYGIALTHTDVQGEDGVNDTVGISVDIDTLAAEIIAKHDVPAPDASMVKLTADVGSNTVAGGATVQSTLENLDSRIKAAVSGGVTGIAAGSGITVTATDVNNPTVAVNTSAIVADGSALTVTDNKIDLIWSELQ